MRTGSSITTEPFYMDVEAVGIYLGIVKDIRGDPNPVATRRRQLMRIYMMVHRRQIPHHKVGRRLLFDKREIDAWIREKGVPVSV
jgi:excisionase family DNA binding protein